MYRQKNTDKHLAYPCFLLPLPRSTAAQKNVHFVLKIGTFRFADYNVERLELVKKYFTPNIVAGFCIFMTNDKSYINTPKGASATFTMEVNKKHKGKLDWAGEVAESTKRKLPPIWLDNEYAIEKWDEVKNKGIEFYYTIVEV